MSTSHKQQITVIAILVFVLTVPMLWQIATVRETQATDEKRSEAAAEVVSTRQAPDDYDGDGLSDTRDRCPTRPETANGFEDGDGCPDVVETTGAS